ncbi:hypothetical protein [Sphingobium yanoikuyae]|uniref:hypothetical protein n=1 Tax=Sphingobium yanoikuyae TaxID=13690 RepID=UPI0022DDB603|nr:hypothetical protein [Sphingobium yanoikuyae]WBQ19149.1 hypothetical protein PAE53_25325 [Sphingobium yanoikuyae]
MIDILNAEDDMPADLEARAGSRDKTLAQQNHPKGRLAPTADIRLKIIANECAS